MIDIAKIESALKNNEGLISSIRYFDEINSTNLYSKSLEQDRVLVLTDFQSEGIGRMNRKWESEKGKNLTFTIKKSFDVHSEHIQSVNFFFCYFVLACLRDFIAKNLKERSKFPELRIKWPNDVLLNSKKICGFLIENTLGRNEFIIGIGINVNQEKFSPEYDYKTTSLRNFLGTEIDISELLIQLIGIFTKNIHYLENHQYALIFKLWKNNTDLLGKEVMFTENGKDSRAGKIIDLLQDGGLKMEVDNVIHTFYSGEIKLLYQNSVEKSIQA